MSPELRQTTGPNAETSEVPRDGPMPRNPFEPYTAEEIACTDGATSPSYAWLTSPHAKFNESQKLLKALPYPHPLPPVYTHSVGYRPSPELRHPWQRMTHVVAVFLTTIISAGVFFFVEPTHKLSDGTIHRSERMAIHHWMDRQLALLRRTPAEVRATKLYALGVPEEQLPEAKKIRAAAEKLKSDLTKAAQQSAQAK